MCKLTLWPAFIALILSHLFTFSSASIAQSPPSNQPNIILLNLDDADIDLLSADNIDQHFPAIAELFHRSTVFSNVHATTPFCGPSRAALMTGKYGFNNGIKTNSEAVASSVGFFGGYKRFQTLGHDENELGVWMKQAGYRTMHVGKFHHDAFDFQKAPGWDDFSVTLGAKYYGTFRYTNINHSPATTYSLREDQYISHEERREALAAINNQKSQRPNQPFFLYYAPFAPHSPQSPDFNTMAEPKYRNYGKDLLLPTDSPNFDEADLSDKVSFLRREPLYDFELERMQSAYVNRVRAVKSVDDVVGALVARLKQTGDWENTYFILTSDNGYFLGQHRVKYKKEPYEQGSRVPLFVTAPDAQAQKHASHLVAHLDLCPTILELAGGVIPSDLDGKSFAQLIDNPEAAPARSWRRSIMIENWSDKYVLGEWIPMAYTAERFYDHVHIAWSSGFHEFYNLNKDPFQLSNIYYQFADAGQQKVNASLLRFRQRDVAPAITLTSPQPAQAVGQTISFTGFMEDNSVPVMAELVVRSYSTNRFFNGDTWQDEYTSIPVLPSSLTSSINTWKRDLNIFSETTSGFDSFVSWVIPIDDSGKRGSFKYSFNPSFNNSIYARINPTIAGNTFNSTEQLLVGYHGKRPGQKVNLSIIDSNTRKFFNGTGFQTQYFAITADSLSNNRWSKSVQLPKGSYECFARSFSENLYNKDPDSAKFTVE